LPLTRENPANRWRGETWFFGINFAKTFSHIARVLREHFHAEVCSLYEFHKNVLTLVAMERQDRSPEKIEFSGERELGIPFGVMIEVPSAVPIAQKLGTWRKKFLKPQESKK
jgi:hypothetical protein